ncbi:MAG: F0F1 ATP synthase subunit alpha, partial [Actinomycetes bacterium]
LAQLERGRRVVEVLKQPQFAPVPVEEQVLALYAVTEGHMDDVAVEDIRRFETGLRQFFNDRYSHVLAHIRDTGSLPEAETLVEGIRAFKETFQPSKTEE